MTDRELEALWPTILAASRNALRRCRAHGLAWDVDAVAVEVAMSLVRYSAAGRGLIERIALCRAADHIRQLTHSRRGAPAAPVGLCPETWKAMRQARPAERPDLEPLRAALRLATPAQRRIIAAIIRAGGSQALAARRLHFTRQTIYEHLHAFRKRFRKLFS